MPDSLLAQDAHIVDQQHGASAVSVAQHNTGKARPGLDGSRGCVCFDEGFAL